ncbi:MAG: SDR family NAD(P)-dependent oxidoreductase [Thermodesulfobacteriota bacterium]
MKKLQDKVAVITGGTGGLGKAVVSLFLAEGAYVLSTYIDDAELEGCLGLRDEYKSRVVFGKANVTKASNVANVAQKTIEKFSRIDILVNLVGGFAQSPLADTDEEAWDTMMNTNLKSAFLTSRSVIPHMIKQGRGSIVNIASRPALKGSPGLAAYGASKAGVLNLTQSMAEELKEHNINVNAVIPGTINTPANRMIMPDADFSKWVDPEDIAKVIAFLCSDDARAVSGAAIPVYGKS